MKKGFLLGIAATLFTLFFSWLCWATFQKMFTEREARIKREAYMQGYAHGREKPVFKPYT